MRIYFIKMQSREIDKMQQYESYQSPRQISPNSPDEHEFERNYSTRSNVSYSSSRQNAKSRRLTPAHKQRINYGNIFSSISPSVSPLRGGFIKQKKQVSSVSPTRKHLYWQSWLIQPSTLSISCVQFPPSISTLAYCAISSETNEILTSKNLLMPLQIASLTKIMTAYTVICIANTVGVRIKQNHITVQKEATWIQGTSANLRGDDELLIIDLLYALLLPSGNDAAITLAQFFGKLLSFKLVRDLKSSEKSVYERFKQCEQFYDQQYKYDSIKLFVFQMNKNAKKIGMVNTNFTNPTGLNDPKSYSNAKDMSVLTSHCLKNHILRTIFKKKVYACQMKNQKLGISRQIQWKNTNKHLFQFRECVGVKTGVTPNAGACLSSAYRIFGQEIILILLNSPNIDQRFIDAERLYKWCRKKIRGF